MSGDFHVQRVEILPDGVRMHSVLDQEEYRSDQMERTSD